jgi:hypothetical protein
MTHPREYRENLEGVHLMNGEFTLCGDSFDIAETEADFEDGPLLLTQKRSVTCARCKAVISLCRGVRTA